MTGKAHIVAQLLKLILLQGGKIMGLPLLAKVGEERELTILPEKGKPPLQIDFLYISFQ